MKTTGLVPSTQRSALAVTVAAALAGFAAIYVTLGGGDNASRAQPGVAAPAVKAVPPGATGKALATGQMAAFVFKPAPEAPPEVAFKNKAGDALTLASFKGRAVLLNLWATWCAPCRKEMPALDRLQAELGSPKFEVVALAADRLGADAAGKFLDQVSARNLQLYVDSTARSASTLRVVGMPTTLLIDAEGREVGRLIGPAEWDSEEAKRLIRSILP